MRTFSSQERQDDWINRYPVSARGFTGDKIKQRMKFHLHAYFCLVLLLALSACAAGYMWPIGTDPDDVQYFPPGPEFKDSDKRG